MIKESGGTRDAELDSPWLWDELPLDDLLLYCRLGSDLDPESPLLPLDLRLPLQLIWPQDMGVRLVGQEALLAESSKFIRKSSKGVLN